MTDQFSIGDLVSLNDKEGEIIEANYLGFKVKWEDGSTSIIRRDNINLKRATEEVHPIVPQHKASVFKKVPYFRAPTMHISDWNERAKASLGEEEFNRRCVERAIKGIKARSNILLNEEAIRDIKRNATRDKTSCELYAAKYGVHRSTIRGIITGRRWKHIQIEGTK